MLAVSSSPVKLSKSTVFSGVNFREKFEDVLQKQFLSVVANHSKSDGFFYRKLGNRKRKNPLSHRTSLKYSNDQRGKLDYN